MDRLESIQKQFDLESSGGLFACYGWCLSVVRELPVSFRERMLIRSMILDLLLFVALSAELKTVGVEHDPSLNGVPLKITLPGCSSVESLEDWLREYTHGDAILELLTDHSVGFPVQMNTSEHPLSFSLRLSPQHPEISIQDEVRRELDGEGALWGLQSLRELTQPLIGGLLSDDRRGQIVPRTESSLPERDDRDRELRSAGFDPLTQLPGKSYFYHKFENYVDQAEENTVQFGVFLLDLDNFSRINASFDHRRGDQLLDRLGRRFSEMLGEDMVVCRWASDVFVFLAPDVESRSGAESLLKRILEVMEEPFSFGEGDIFLKGSMGAAFYPDDGKEASELVSMAEQAMHDAKKEKGNSYTFYTSGEVESARERLMLSTDLHQAFNQDQFELFYQPLVNLRTLEVEGAETLLRWRHPDRGLMTPTSFLGALEDTGLILFVGKWVLETALDQLRVWTGEELGPYTIQINTSPRQFRDPSLVQNIETALNETRVDPSRVRIEITEHVMMNDLEHSKLVLNELNELGIGVSLDDFGTGHSSFSYLADLPLSEIKIDRSFLAPFDKESKNLKLVEIMALAAQRLDLSSVAEGVETREQFEFVREKGIDLAQGHFVSRPLPPDEFRNYCKGELTEPQLST